MTEGFDVVLEAPEHGVRLSSVEVRFTPEEEVFMTAFFIVQAVVPAAPIQPVIDEEATPTTTG